MQTPDVPFPPRLRAPSPAKASRLASSRLQFGRLLLIALVSLPWLFAGLNGPSTVSAAGSPVIAAAGDISCDPAQAGFLGGKTYCKAPQTANALAAGGVAAVLALGDDQYYCGSLAAYTASYALTWGRLKAITHPVPGNHEFLTSGSGAATGCNSTNKGGAGYYAYFGAAAGPKGKGYYSFNVGAWHLIALNSTCAAAGGCTAGSPQGKWLAADLAAHRNQCVLAYWHIPLFSSGGRASAATRPFWTMLYAAHADVVLDAHDHIYERFAPQTPTGAPDPVNGIREFTVGTGGANHTGIASIAANSVVRNDTTFGFLRLTLNPTSYSWVYQSVFGGSFSDSGTGTCH